jgi:hypothetical protein
MRTFKYEIALKDNLNSEPFLSFGKYLQDKFNVDITVIEIPKSEIKSMDFTLCAQPVETLGNFYKRQTQKPSVLTNCGFFDMSNGNTGMTYVSEGKVIKRGDWALKGFGVTKDGKVLYGNVDKRNDWKSFVGAYPALIEDYKPLKITTATELNYPARRTVLAETPDTLFCILIEGAGLDFKDMQDILIGLKVQNAANYDGGGSTNAYVNGEKITSRNYDRAVDNVMCVYLKDGTPEPIPVPVQSYYSVIAGKALLKSNAEKVRTKVITLPDKYYAGYKNAFVSKKGMYYYVQIGIYSKKETADMVKNDLLSLGVDAEVV